MSWLLLYGALAPRMFGRRSGHSDRVCDCVPTKDCVLTKDCLSQDLVAPLLGLAFSVFVVGLIIWCN
jgi:hypothetical protein